MTDEYFKPIIENLKEEIGKKLMTDLKKTVYGKVESRNRELENEKRKKVLKQRLIFQAQLSKITKKKCVNPKQFNRALLIPADGQPKLKPNFNCLKGWPLQANGQPKTCTQINKELQKVVQDNNRFDGAWSLQANGQPKTNAKINSQLEQAEANLQFLQKEEVYRLLKLE